MKTFYCIDCHLVLRRLFEEADQVEQHLASVCDACKLKLKDEVDRIRQLLHEWGKGTRRTA